MSIFKKVSIKDVSVFLTQSCQQMTDDNVNNNNDDKNNNDRKIKHPTI